MIYCDVCDKKPGSPTLCRACLEHRALESLAIEAEGLLFRATLPTGTQGAWVNRAREWIKRWRELRRKETPT